MKTIVQTATTQLAALASVGHLYGYGNILHCLACRRCKERRVSAYNKTVRTLPTEQQGRKDSQAVVLASTELNTDLG